MSDGPTPILATHVIAFTYVINGLTHAQRSYVNASRTLDSTGWSLLTESTAYVNMSEYIAKWAAKVGPVMGSDATGGAVTLYEFVGVSLVPVYSNSLTFTPSGATGQVAQQSTMFFRNAAQESMRFVLFETNFPAPLKSTNPAASVVGAAMGALLASLISNADAELGGSIRSRSAGFPNRFISVVSALNRNIRRRRGLA